MDKSSSTALPHETPLAVDYVRAMSRITRCIAAGRNYPAVGQEMAPDAGLEAELPSQHAQQLQNSTEELFRSTTLKQMLCQEQEDQATLAICRHLKTETLADFSEKSWRESQELERVFADEDYLLIKSHKSPKNLSNLGRALHSSGAPHRRRRNRAARKPESDEPKGIVLYLQPINHDLTFNTNSTIDKSTQI